MDMANSLDSLFEDSTFDAEHLTQECFGNVLNDITLPDISTLTTEGAKRYPSNDCCCPDCFCGFLKLDSSDYDISSILGDSREIITNSQIQPSTESIQRCSTMMNIDSISSIIEKLPTPTDQLDAICEWFLDVLTPNEKDLSATSRQSYGIGCASYVDHKAMNCVTPENDIISSQAFLDTKLSYRQKACNGSLRHTVAKRLKRRLTKLVRIFKK